MRPYSTVRGWLVRMMRRGLGGRFDLKSTERKKILDSQTSKKKRSAYGIYLEL